MENISVTVFLLLLVCASFSGCLSEQDNYDGLLSKMSEWLNPHSFLYDKERKKMMSMESTEPTEMVAVNNVPQQHISQEYIFYRRLVKLILSKMSMKDDHSNVSGALLFEGSVSDFKHLQEFVDGKSSIREADRILSNIMKDSKSNGMFSTIYKMSYDYTDQFFYLTEVFTENAKTIIIIVCCTISYIWLKNIRWSPALFLFSLIVLIFGASFFIVWYQLIQEAQIKLRVVQDQFTDIPISCQPDKMNIWQQFVGFVRSDNSCEKYYKSVMSNPLLEVTPAFVLSHLLSTVVLHPISYSGTVIHQFMEGATGQLPIYERVPVMLMLYTFVGVLFVLLPICLTGTCVSVGLGPFGRILTFGMSGTKSDKSSKGRKNLERIEDVYEDSTDDRATPKITGSLGRKKCLKVTDGKNYPKSLEVCKNKDCDMASGDKIRKSEYSDSENEIYEECKHCDSRSKEVGSGRGDC